MESLAEDEMTATDVFQFDVRTARLRYLLNKKRRGEPFESMPAIPRDPNDPLMQNTEELPAFLRRQAD